jgi:TPR repeat protein
VKSLHNLGLIYYEGKLVKRNEQKSRDLLRRAADKGDIEGRIMFIELMLNEATTCSPDQLADLNRFCREIIAKEDDNADAYYFLGIMVEEGYGCLK